MDLTEATGLLARFMSPYRTWRRESLVKLADKETVKVGVGESGASYRMELHVTLGSSRDPTMSVTGTATQVGSRRWFKQRAVVGFRVLEDGTVAHESGFDEEAPA